MKAFQGQSTGSANLKRSRSLVGRTAGPGVRNSWARSSSYVSVPTARTNAYNGSDFDSESLAMVAQDAVKQPAPFMPRDANDGVAEIDILGIGQAAVSTPCCLSAAILPFRCSCCHSIGPCIAQ
eukprot:GHUV01042210.1.p1 GENE.GHUV01042210.1~~GHUV01042210.1.p1  ORF type:complete len:124 (+),score=2.07 GHUV01042210.1:429-800(+)